MFRIGMKFSNNEITYEFCKTFALRKVLAHKNVYPLNLEMLLL